MAKLLDNVKMIVTGDDTGPQSARFVYKIVDSGDANLSKVVNLDVTSPVFDSGTLLSFYDGYIDVIKDNEGIA